MTTLLQKTRRINELLQQKNTLMNTSSMPYNRMAMILGDILDTIT
ncbi:GTP-sensing pleiotropic transcriptional regulator CodY, partial [Enterococcus cecorum]|nr:GTP-sensing pleiotropic transcriptional regulator CodY [Enterococcus cecorum]